MNEHINNVTDTLDDLVHRRDCWERDQLLASNKVLYQLLAECYSLVDSIKKRRDLQQQLRNYLDDRRINFNSKTPLATKVVKAVFGVDRQRAYTYSKVLRAAFEADVEAQRFADWVEALGGIEEVRLRSGNAKPASTTRRREAAIQGKALLDQATELCRFPTPNGQYDEVGPVLLLAFASADGTTSIRSYIASQALVQAGLADFWHANGRDETDADQSTVSAAMTDAVDAAVNAVVQNDDDQKAA
jgi:hypothetical protein